ncbi:hypothetical protein SUGI_0705740 [Cryptomeria japonica]|uniref:coniferyl alcohol acyltransferase-like n=1 Tax=Cryptomeria japonica TaxID=3369 RepID=UPI0024149EB1|nr:coniferyl alcohol acyltransferase-like [Cryptomeria japonica]GLJ35079.1 hypothetical protein SUGI_0705740 [Cryptomeria japonica]
MASVNSPICKDYWLNIVNTEAVMPALPMQQHILPLSNLDLLIPPVYVYVFFCYKNPFPRTFASAISHLKASLSRVLVPYYAFAGRLVIDSIGPPKVHCNNKGVRFTQAYAAPPLSHLNLYNPDESVQGKLVPLPSMPFQEDGTPVFRIQVSEFSCGDIVIGFTFDHRIVDVYSANMFFVSWAKLWRNDSTVSPTPSFTRSILCPTDSPAYSPEIENMYVRYTSQESYKENPHPPCLSSRIYYLDVKNIKNLQFNANKDGNKYTKLEVFNAYLWKLLICTQNVKDTENCKIGIAVDGRPRLSEIEVSTNYFGNVIGLPFAESNAYCIKTISLCWSAGLIHDAIQSVANKEHFKSLIDFVETIKLTPVLAKIYCRENGMQSSGPAVVVSSGVRFPLYEVDYGWGKPTFGCYHFPWGGEAGYVMPSHSPAGDGSWLVYVHLPKEQLNAIESDPNCILLPIAQDLLHLA